MVTVQSTNQPNNHLEIDWKVVCQSPGYKSLKNQYEVDLTTSAKYCRRNYHNRKTLIRDKQRYQTKFRWVIGRAMHYAVANGTTLQNVLDTWETERTYWWVNYYIDSNFPKIKKKSVRQ